MLRTLPLICIHIISPRMDQGSSGKGTVQVLPSFNVPKEFRDFTDACDDWLSSIRLDLFSLSVLPSESGCRFESEWPAVSSDVIRRFAWSRFHGVRNFGERALGRDDATDGGMTPRSSRRF